MKLKPLNLSGINPTEYKVLVLPSKIEEKTKGGILLPNESQDRNQFAQMEGQLIACSPLAFTYDEWKTNDAPKAGDRVLYAKYAGAMVKGKDGEDYRLINDKDISAVLS